MTNSVRGQWGSRYGFVLAAAGSAVGLGNIWKFPYITGENGGGLFVLIYLFCIALVGLPIMLAEIMIGRAAQKQPIAAFHELQGGRSSWATVGWLGVICGFIILSYYVVVAGWAMDYTLKSVVNITVPIEQEATTAARTYRATASLPQMRTHLAATRAEREARDEIALVRRRARPSSWKDWGDFQAALAAAADEDQAERRLLEVPSMLASIDAVRPLAAEVAAIEGRRLEEARQHYRSMADLDVRDEAETLRRRELISGEVSSRFMAVFEDGWTSTFWSGLFLMVTILIVSTGISAGIERTCRILMPTLIVLMLVMVGFGAFQPGFGEALSFVFRPDPSKLRASGVLEALGHAFFTLSLGMGAMITYGSYQKRKEGLASESIAICLFDTGIALLACMMMFPIIFSYGQEASAGPGLVFISMPLAFAEIGQGGMLLAILFFGLLVFAALTSAISLLEVVCSFFIDEHAWSRRRSAWLLGAAVFLLSIPSAFSGSEGFVMGSWEPSFGKNFFDTMDYLATNWMLPVGGLLIAIYAGWVMPAKIREAELVGASAGFVLVWLVLIRFIAPALVLIVLAQKVGILNVDELFYG